MTAIKTLRNDANVTEFVDAVADKQKRDDCHALLKLFQDCTGEVPAMWGESIVGYGSYHYKSQRSTQEGDWPLTGFSPRKQNITLYIMPGFDTYADLLAQLGKYKTSVSCLYIRKLSDVNIDVLAKIITNAAQQMTNTIEIDNQNNENK